MASLEEYYRILELRAEASIDEIKKAYRNKARQYHPDLNPSSKAHAEFLKINEAYHYLISFRQKEHTLSATISQKKNKAEKATQAYARKRYEQFIKSNETIENTLVH